MTKVSQEPGQAPRGAGMLAGWVSLMARPGGRVSTWVARPSLAGWSRSRRDSRGDRKLTPALDHSPAGETVVPRSRMGVRQWKRCAMADTTERRRVPWW
jgi:hypothetical protein